MRKATGILLTATGLLAAGNSARAQTQVTLAPAGQAYTIINNVSASAINPVTYQWYRDNNPISGATGASYTVPKSLAYGENVQFYRMATAQECSGVAEKKSNTVTITFTGYIMPAGCALVVDGTCWAAANVDNLQTFATRADMNTKFYQWNRLTAYSADAPLSPSWNATADESETWTVNPCPPNWRLPAKEEYQALHNSGSSWAAENTGRGNAVAGRFYGYNHATCSLPSNMTGCVFFPASGLRGNEGGALYSRGVGGNGWSSTQASSTNGYYLYFDSGTSGPATNNSKAYGFPVRCVR